jgi:hypothetical protein
MNGGIHHAIECVGSAELRVAAAGYAFFGMAEVAEFLRGAASDPILFEWNDETERIANDRYASLVPEDAYLAARFHVVYRERPDQFSPVTND